MTTIRSHLGSPRLQSWEGVTTLSNKCIGASMAKIGKGPSLWQKAAVEAIGVFLLVFFGMGAVVGANLSAPGFVLLSSALAHGLALAIAVTIALGISGGHINPAVTVSMWITRRIRSRDAIVYIISQVLGGSAATIALLAALPVSLHPLVASGAPALAQGVTVLQGIIVEALITFALVFAVFGTAVDKRSVRMGGFGIGLTLMIGILFAGPITGAAANPAVALGPELMLMNFSNWYVYWIGPVIGGVIAALLYQYVILGKERS